ncbi:hypothetical protein DSO57_1023724 [Entomophthora muscae]|uniref:Uncharacterized protein n=1 Tax=Entomophthora muscae TaxID=34485 RepID=A0ACC2UCF9_9FUNG|nr:hypothetical protein DSO57_1023724 [Entomophthora muscae]
MASRQTRAQKANIEKESASKNLKIANTLQDAAASSSVKNESPAYSKIVNHYYESESEKTSNTSQRKTYGPDSAAEEQQSEGDIGLNHEVDELNGLSFNPERTGGLSAYEIQRLENIRNNQAVLRTLNIGGVGGITASAVAPRSKPKSRTALKRIRPEKPPVAPRASRRLKGENPEQIDPDLLKKHDLYAYTLVDPNAQPVKFPSSQDNDASQSHFKKLKPDSTFDAALEFSSLVTDLMASSQESKALGLLSLETAEKFTDDDLIHRIRRLRCATQGTTKLTQQRIYSMQFHPDPNKLLLAAGSKVGELSLWDASLYAEEWRTGTPGLASADDFDPDSLVFRFQPHYHAVTGLHFHPACRSKLVSSSHDGTIRLLDMENKTIVSALSGTEGSLSLTSLDFAIDQPHVAFFSSYSGDIGFHDLRTTGLGQPTALYNLNANGKKIGCLTLNPVRPYLLATASNDRTIKLWDTRNLKSSTLFEPLCQINFPNSVNSAHWDPTGNQLVSTGFEHALRVLDASLLDAGTELPQISKSPHNCRTGKYVTLLQAKFHPDPLIGQRIVTVGDMKRGVDFYSSKTGKPLVKFADSSFITAIPAVLAYHPQASLDDSLVGSALACGNASGYAFILM